MEGYSGVAHKYCRDVLSGKISACIFIKQACQATLDDLAWQRDKDCPYFYDAPYAERVCRFIESLPHVKGQWARQKDNRLKMEPWQVWMTCRLMGWKDKASRVRRFTEIYAEIPRKNAKTTWLAALLIYLAFADGEFGAEVYCGASKLEQAMILFSTARLMVLRTPDLMAALDIEVSKQSLWRESDGSRFTPVVGDPGDGSSPSTAALDELHEQLKAALRDAMITGMGAREQPLLAEITTAGVNTEGPCYEVRTRAIEVLKGADRGGFREDTLLAIIYTIDEGDDPMTEAALRKANPNMGVSVQVPYLLRQMQSAKNDPSQSFIYRTKHLNIWGQSKRGFFNMVAFNSSLCCDPSLKLEDFRGKECWEGDDLAARQDLASRALIFPELRPTGPNGRMERHYIVFGKHYAPLATIYDGMHRNYIGWYESPSKWLTGHIGPEIKLANIQADMEADLQMFDYKRMAFDRAFARQMQQALEEITPTDTVIDVPQTAQMLSDGMKELAAAIVSGRFHHNGDPILAWCMGNLVSRQDKNENEFPDKESPQNKIDAASALITGMSQVYSAPLAPPKRFTSPHIGFA